MNNKIKFQFMILVLKTLSFILYYVASSHHSRGPDEDDQQLIDWNQKMIEDLGKKLANNDVY